VTVTAAGAVAVKGAATPMLGDATLATAGAVAIVGTATIVLGDVTMTASDLVPSHIPGVIYGPNSSGSMSGPNAYGVVLAPNQSVTLRV